MPWYDSGGVSIYVTHVLDALAALPAESIQTVVTSPPYYGLRAYNTAPVIWGGAPDCDHQLDAAPGRTLEQGRCRTPSASMPRPGTKYKPQTITTGATAWEETPPGKVLTGGTGTASAKQVTNAGSQYGNAWADNGTTKGSTLNQDFNHRWNPDWAPGGKQSEMRPAEVHHGATCRRCGAWRGELGSEPTPDCLAWARGAPPCSACYVCHLVVVFRAVRRVLHDSGCIFVNLGDSYSGSGKGPTGYNGIGDQGQRQGFVGVSSKSTLHGGKGVGPHEKMAQPVLGGGRAVDGLGPKQLMMLPARVALALQADGWVLRSDIIWCLSGGTRVYARTQKGDMPTTLKDIARLRPETVQLWSGERWTQLLGMSETPRETAIEILLRSGERIGCTPHHEWPTQRGLVRADALQVGDVIQATRLPEPTSAKLPSALSDDMVGWFVGLYLAEGWMDAKAIYIAGHTKETDRYARCQRLAEVFQGWCTWRTNKGNSATIILHGKILRAIVETYIAGSTSADKRLTNACWQRADTFLRALLDGYLHGDGHYDAVNDRWRLGFRRNYALEADFRTLCARLGVSLRLHLRLATLNGKSFPMHRGELRFSKSAHHNVKQDAEIVALGRSRGRKFWHLGVADAPHLFALGSGVLTSNSKPNPMPESVTDRPTTAHEHLFLLSKRADYYYDAEAIKESSIRAGDMPGGNNGRGVGEFGVSPHAAFNGTVPSHRNRRSVWTIPTEAYPAAHFATFPRKLVEPCVLAGTSARGQCNALVKKLQLRSDLTAEERAKVYARLGSKGLV